MSNEVNLEKAVGFELPSKDVGWNTRDLLLYAVGIGAKSQDLKFVYELDPQFTPFPTYPVVLSLKGTSQDIIDFTSAHKAGKVIPGLPAFDVKRVVHGYQTIQMLRPLPAASGPGWKLKRRVVGVQENKSGVIVDEEALLVDASGTAFARLYGGTFNVGAKATGSKFSKVIAGPPVAKPIPKDRQPDYVVEERLGDEQALIYRLSGDYNPLHIDPKIGEGANFGGVIIHGLATYGFGARHVLSSVAANDASALTCFGVRFTSPVKPGNTLRTEIWAVGKGPVSPDGRETVELTFQTKVIETGKVCLGAGIAYVAKPNKGKL